MDTPQEQPLLGSLDTFFWPQPLRKEAFRGLAGDVVRLIEPQSEADPAALLLQFLAGVGSVVGRDPHYIVEADRHGPNLFVCVVGQSALARKGTSWGQVERILKLVDPEWYENCINYGLASGEVVIELLKDPTYVDGPDGTPAILEQGVKDKRLFMLETEFASTLTIMKRPNNLLSSVLRNAWDGRTLRNNSKTQGKLKASEPHLTVVGHITFDELRGELSDTAITNGFANRFLWCAAKRSKSLPEGGYIDPVAIEDLAAMIRMKLREIKGPTLYEMDEEAKSEWRLNYEQITDVEDGALGAATSRGTPQILRIAMLYAVLDSSPVIHAEHLIAALAVWDYCLESAAAVFSNHGGNPVLDKLRMILLDNPEGLSQTEIYRYFGSNIAASRISMALKELEPEGLICESRPTGRGRPKTVWRFSY